MTRKFKSWVLWLPAIIAVGILLALFFLLARPIWGKITWDLNDGLLSRVALTTAAIGAAQWLNTELNNGGWCTAILYHVFKWRCFVLLHKQVDSRATSYHTAGGV
ncbi:hypothetical protein V8C86DRAFT_2993642 [Haematococcus lacustris]